MAIVVPDEGERYFLNLLLRDTVPSTLKFIIGLYRGDWTPNRESVLADVLEANFSGYLPLEADRSVWTAAQTVGGSAQSTYGVLFQQWIPSSGTQRIYGWYARDEDSNVLLWAERFSAFIDASPAVPVFLMPVVQLHSTFEPAPPP